MTDATINYSSLIKEAFIKPIRNVTVIDDEYPTLLSLIELQFSNSRKQSSTENTGIDANVERLKKIINMCHTTYQWGIDVFSGRHPKIGGERNIPPHIHHSDLIILDYHLDGEPQIDDGSRAREIIKSLDQNNHYNLILVHTKGYGDDIKKFSLKSFVS